MAQKFYEVGGKLYEAITACALEDLKMSYTWNPPLLLMRIVPDFVVPNERKPEMVILVTHSTSSSGTNMKFWRTIDELFEIKGKISPQCKALNLVYSSRRGWKTQLLTIFEKVFDGNLIIFERAYGEEFLNLLHETALMGLSDLSFEKSKEVVSKKIKENGKLDDIYHNHFLKDFKSFVDSSLNKDLTELWESERNEITAACERNRPEIRNVYFKRGLIKASFLSAEETAILKNRILSSNSRTFILDDDTYRISQHLQDIGLIKIQRTIVGRQGVLDRELYFILRTMSVNEIDFVVDFVNKKHPELNDYLVKVRDTNTTKRMIDEIRQRINERPHDCEKILFDMLRQCHNEKDYLGIKSNRNWVLESCMDIIRYLEPALRYSYDVLSRESNLPMTGGFSPIPLFARGDQNLSDEDLRKVAKALADHLASTEKTRIKTSQIVPTICHHVLITLAKHRTINFLKLFVLLELKKRGYEISEENVRIRSCLSEYSRVRLGVADSIFTLRVRKNERNMIVDVIAAYEATHKHKELSGRIRASKYQWVENTFRKREDIRRWILILDGPWKTLSGGQTRFFDTLLEAGWDTITYPDKLDEIMGSEK